MNFYRGFFILPGLLGLFSGWTTLPSVAALPAENLARVHWLGFNQISADTNSARFMTVWRLPQTQSLLAQTLDKVSRLPDGGATNAGSKLLRPLLDDLVSSEFYLEVNTATNRPSLSAEGEGRNEAGLDDSQVFLAVHLAADRARLWQTNLAAALGALTHVHPVPAVNGWWLQLSNSPGRIELSRIGEWTLVRLGPGASISDFATRVVSGHAPPATDFWLEANLNVARLAGVFSRSVSDSWFLSLVTQHSSLSNLDLTVSGEKGGVLARAISDFSRPQKAPLPAWDVPTNLIHQPLTSFTAVRGFAPWLAGLSAWQQLQLNPPPDQVFFWAQEGVPFLTDFAAPLTSASNQLAQLAGRLVQNVNPWLATNAEGTLAWQTNPPGLVWKHALILSPCLESVSVNRHEYLLGGLYPPAAADTNPPPAGFLLPMIGRTNLVYYQSEQTGQRLEDGQFINQMCRMIFHKPQLPGTSAAGAWLIKVEPLLGDSTTIVTRTGAQQFTFTRHSTIGLTALELHLLADWLESPQFPHGLHSTR